MVGGVAALFSGGQKAGDVGVWVGGLDRSSFSAELCSFGVERGGTAAAPYVHDGGEMTAVVCPVGAGGAAGAVPA